MRNRYLLVVAACGLLTLEQLLAQGTLYLSNLGETSTGGITIGSDAWGAAFFRTGTNSDGYTLGSVQLLMAPQSGNPSGLAVSIYSYNNRFPGNSLGMLTGSDPVGGGIFTYSTPGIALSSSTPYFLVLTSATPASQGSFAWSTASTGGFVSNNDWSVGFGGNGLGFLGSLDGINWMGLGSLSFSPLFAINATGVPEPVPCVLVGLGLICFGCLRRNCRLNIKR